MMSRAGTPRLLRALNVIVGRSRGLRESFSHVKGWLSDIDRYAQGNIKVQKMLVGNKSDLTNREVPFKEAKARFLGSNREKNL